jgi:hypothetical protein
MVPGATPPSTILDAHPPTHPTCLHAKLPNFRHTSAKCPHTWLWQKSFIGASEFHSPILHLSSCLAVPHMHVNLVSLTFPRANQGMGGPATLKKIFQCRCIQKFCDFVTICTKVLIPAISCCKFGILSPEAMELPRLRHGAGSRLLPLFVVMKSPMRHVEVST